MSELIKDGRVSAAMSNNFNEAKKTIDAFAAMGLTDFNIHCNPHTLMKDLLISTAARENCGCIKLRQWRAIKSSKIWSVRNEKSPGLQYSIHAPENGNDKPTSERPYHPYIFLMMSHRWWCRTWKMMACIWTSLSSSQETTTVGWKSLIIFWHINN